MPIEPVRTEESPSNRPARRRRRIVAAVLAALVLGGGGGVAYANHSFPDVPTAAYYHDAVAWAKGNGITTGVGDTGKFMPLRPTNRAEVVTFQHRYHEKMNPTITYTARVSVNGSLQNGVGATGAMREATGRFRVDFAPTVTGCVPSVMATATAGQPRFATLLGTSINSVLILITDAAGTEVNTGFVMSLTCPSG